MKVSQWKTETEPFHSPFMDAWLKTVGIETTADGRPIQCVIILARYNDVGEVMTMELEMDLEESTKIVGGWDKALGDYMAKYFHSDGKQ